MKKHIESKIHAVTASIQYLWKYGTNNKILSVSSGEFESRAAKGLPGEDTHSCRGRKATEDMIEILKIQG